MKKVSLLVWFSMVLLLLSGCALRGDAADLYKKEMPLQVEVNVPQEINAGERVAMEATLKQGKEWVEKADYVHFEVLNQDGSVYYPMEEANEKANGVYSLSVEFEKDGLYYLEVHAGNNGSLVSPQHQFIVGELSDKELESLKQGPSPENEGDGQHH
jgi:hypothetical protein